VDDDGVQDVMVKRGQERRGADNTRCHYQRRRECRVNERLCRCTTLAAARRRRRRIHADTGHAYELREGGERCEESGEERRGATPVATSRSVFTGTVLTCASMPPYDPGCRAPPPFSAGQQHQSDSAVVDADGGGG
jgi:hypothetical protein